MHQVPMSWLSAVIQLWSNSPVFLVLAHSRASCSRFVDKGLAANRWGIVLVYTVTKGCFSSLLIVSGSGHPPVTMYSMRQVGGEICVHISSTSGHLFNHTHLTPQVEHRRLGLWGINRPIVFSRHVRIGIALPLSGYTDCRGSIGSPLGDTGYQI